MPAEINVTPTSVESSHRLLNILSHGAWVLSAPILIPLVIYLVTKRDHTTVPAHAAEAFNFHVSWAIWSLCCIPLMLLFGLGTLLLFGLGIAAFVLMIIAIVKAANDELYRYPMTIRFIQV